MTDKQTPTTPPNRSFLEFRISVANSAHGHNDFVTMEAKPSGNFVYKEGPIGDTIIGAGHIRREIFPGADWDEIYTRTVSRGFTLVNETKMQTMTAKQKITTSNNGLSPIEDDDVRNFLDGIISTATETMTKLFTVRVTDIRDEHIEQADKLLAKMWAEKDKLKLAEFNKLLDQLHLIIPRRIPNVRYTHAASMGQAESILTKEQDIFDFVVGNVRMARKSAAEVTVREPGKKEPTILEKNGCEMRKVTQEEEKFVRDLMHGTKVSKIFACNNKKTEKDFEAFIKARKLGKYAEKDWDYKTPQGSAHNGVAFLMHGSSDCNWESIFFNGMYVPEDSSGAAHGRAFGNGAYFADLAQKSAGYTSLSGSYWAGGSGGRGLIGIYEVATGEVYDIYGEGKGVPQNWSQLQTKHPGADCLWAMSKRSDKSSYLMNEEIIIYKAQQCTIRFLAEIVN